MRQSPPVVALVGSSARYRRRSERRGETLRRRRRRHRLAARRILALLALGTTTCAVGDRRSIRPRRPRRVSSSHLSSRDLILDGSSIRLALLTLGRDCAAAAAKRAAAGAGSGRTQSAADSFETVPDHCRARRDTGRRRQELSSGSNGASDGRVDARQHGTARRVRLESGSPVRPAGRASPCSYAIAVSRARRLGSGGRGRDLVAGVAGRCCLCLHDFSERVVLLLAAGFRTGRLGCPLAETRDEETAADECDDESESDQLGVGRSGDKGLETGSGSGRKRCSCSCGAYIAHWRSRSRRERSGGGERGAWRRRRTLRDAGGSPRRTRQRRPDKLSAGAVVVRMVDGPRASPGWTPGRRRGGRWPAVMGRDE